MWQAAVQRLCITLCLALLCGPATAGSWRLTDNGPSTARLTWVDGSGFDDTFLSFRPGVRLTGTGGRVTGDIAYTASLDQQLGGDGDFNLSHNLRANANARLYEQMVFLRATASAGLASADGRGLIGSDGISSIFDGDIVQTYSASVTPELRNRFGSFADSRLTMTLDVVDSDDEDADFLSAGSDLTWVLSSGRQFSVLPWSLTARTNRLSYDDRDDQRDSITGQVSRRFDRRWLARASIGYEQNDVQTDRDQTDGVTWSVGGTWTATPRTSFDADYGERYFGNTWNLRATHTSRRTTLTAAYTRDISNVRSQILEQGRVFFFIDPVTGEPVRDPATGALILFDEGLVPSLVNEDFVSERLSLSVGVVGRRTTGTLSLGWSNRDYEVSPTVEDDYNVRLNLSRQLRSDLSGNLTFGWQQVDSNTAPDTEVYFVQAGANHRWGRRSTLGLETSYRTEDVEDADSTDEVRVALVYSIEFF
jgi:uncharacterized protein (PEP-CTERM system associated)